MKTIKLFLLSLIACFSIACTKSEASYSSYDEPFEIALTAALPEVSVAPMTKTDASSDDLYYVSITEPFNFADTHPDSRYTNTINYASGLFDNLNTPIKLYKNHTYFINVIYIPNGKNLIQNRGKGYGTPFTADLGQVTNGGYAPIFGQYSYDARCYASNAHLGMVHYAHPGPNRNTEELHSSVERYDGGLLIHTGDGNVTNFTIDLYKQMFELDVTVENLDEGKIFFVIGDTYKNATQTRDRPVFTLTPSNTNTSQIMQMPITPFQASCGQLQLIKNTDGQVAYTGERIDPYTKEYYENWFLLNGYGDIYFYYEDGVGAVRPDPILIYNIAGVRCGQKIIMKINADNYIENYIGGIFTNFVQTSTENINVVL